METLHQKSPSKMEIFTAIQVCYELNEDNRKREFAGLIGAMKRLRLTKGIILTYDQEDELKIGGKPVVIKPVWKWLVECSHNQ
ncbi:hypothetical protein COT48_03985 [Candidatus Woesearchaeota archaeon CG08_land_8_20_14_0_20_47_9]|nr:MAG: hypothetical protein AUJ69_02450 [Candidatus Woesearchaeota archaeon CG1_02_47_18]PIN74502.1 MAG: hypothetical protein COV22_01105 [Candidatus Woesearchaeota archaeon CG10_big_fil_rev_8_21_14_0_10_47_5]PIO03649.1 MAG: hypothetical protein COT48_03985 [Candidatus Woesearchaeota archaeon CG08_land_8_20_14_0_20_47_9]